MSIGDTQAWRASGERVINAVNREGRRTVVGSEPLLETVTGEPSKPQILLRGRAGATYVLEYATTLGEGSHWEPFGLPLLLDGTSRVVPLDPDAVPGETGSTYIRARMQ